MPFRTVSGIQLPKIEKTFDNVRLIMEPTLYAKHFLTRHDPESFITPNSTFDHEWQYIPIPFYFDPETGEIKKAWTVGSLDIRHIVQYTNKDVDAVVRVATYGSNPVDISTVAIPAANAAPIRLFTDYLVDVDLTSYDAIGVGSTGAEETEYNYTISTSLLWRPKLL